MTEHVHIYGIVELNLQSAKHYEHPDLDCQVSADFISPAGKTTTVRAFWDGDWHAPRLFARSHQHGL